MIPAYTGYDYMDICEDPHILTGFASSLAQGL